MEDPYCKTKYETKCEILVQTLYPWEFENVKLNTQVILLTTYFVNTYRSLLMS